MDVAKAILPKFDEHSPVLAFSSPFFLSFFGLALSFLVLKSRYSTAKQQSWIITTMASGIMSLASLPFLWDFLRGGSVRDVRTWPSFAILMNRFFQGYLVVDLVAAAAFYRSHVTMLAGWIHHPVYILIVEVVIRRSWSHLFCLCAAMEIPTFVLGISSLYPQLRNNVVFAVAFFATRIVLHLVLGFSYFSFENRVATTGGSIVPSFILALIFPLHLTWFVGCIRGFIKRAASKRIKSIPAPRVVSLNIERVVAPEPHISPIAAQSRTVPKPLEVPLSNSPERPPEVSAPFKIRLSHRRQSFERAVRSLQLDFLVLPSSSTLSASKVSLSGKVAEYLPARDAVYDYVGLGRKVSEPSTRGAASRARTL